MNELEQYLTMMLDAKVDKIIISNPSSKANDIKKIVVDKKSDAYQISKYTQKQVFHENISEKLVKDKCIELVSDNYRQVNGLAQN